MKFTDSFFAEHMKPINGSAIREIFKLLGRPGMISFAGGNPSYKSFEPDVIRDIADEVLTQNGPQILQYGATDGYIPFKESAAEFLRGEGMAADASCVLPTQGSSQAMDLIFKSMLNPGDAVLVEDPTFLGALQIMHTYNARVIPMPSDDLGLIPEEAEKLIRQYRPKVMYVIPTFQNPSGKTLPLERRKEVARLANEYGVVVIEDDPYRNLRYSGEVLPAIKSFDEEGWVVYLTSFSKYISPGLRVGAALANPVLYRKMVISKQSADTHSPLLTQAIVDGYLRRGLLPGHIEKISAIYKAQRDRMLDGFRYLPAGVKYTAPDGGLFIWAELPEGTDALKALDVAVEKGVAFVPGTHFYENGGHLNTFRLNFSMSELPQIDEGMQKLGEALK